MKGTKGEHGELAVLERRMFSAWLRLGNAERNGLPVATLEPLYDAYVQALTVYLIAEARYQRELLQQLRMEGMTDGMEGMTA